MNRLFPLRCAVKTYAWGRPGPASLVGRLSAANALTHPLMRAVTGDSPQAILTEDRRPVKALLGEFNMQRSVAKLGKGAHRRRGLDDRKEGSSSSVPH